MKNNWRTARLSEICSIATGKWDANHATQNGKYKFFTCAKEPFYCDTFKFSGECLILPGNGVNVGEVFYYNGDFDAYQRTYVLNCIKAEARFLHYHFLLYWKERNLSKQFGSATNFIKMENFLNYEVFLPSIDEQKRIVKILDEVFDSVAKAKEAAEKNLKNAREVFESYLQSVFFDSKNGWEVKKLKEICNYDKIPNKKANLPYVGLEDIESNTARLIGPLSPRSVKSLTFNFTEEHVLYGRLRPYLNKVLLPNFEGHCSTEIFPIKPKKNLDREFLFRWLTCSETVKKINSTWTGATLPRANMNEVLEFLIPVPPLDQQKQIVAKLDALSTETKKLEEIYKQKLTHLEELKKSILKKAFNAEL